MIDKIDIKFFLFAVKGLLHVWVRLVTCNRYHFWLLPNLSEDVGVLESFWPICSLMHRHQLIWPTFTDEIVQTEEPQVESSEVTTMTSAKEPADDRQEMGVNEGDANQERREIDQSAKLGPTEPVKSQDEMDVCLNELTKRSINQSNLFDVKLDQFEDDVEPEVTSVGPQPLRFCSPAQRCALPSHMDTDEEQISLTSSFQQHPATIRPLLTSSLALSSLLQPVKEWKGFALKSSKSFASNKTQVDEEFEILDKDWDKKRLN